MYKYKFVVFIQNGNLYEEAFSSPYRSTRSKIQKQQFLVGIVPVRRHKTRGLFVHHTRYLSCPLLFAFLLPMADKVSDCLPVLKDIVEMRALLALAALEAFIIIICPRPAWK